MLIRAPDKHLLKYFRLLRLIKMRISMWQIIGIACPVRPLRWKQRREFFSPEQEVVLLPSTTDSEIINGTIRTAYALREACLVQLQIIFSCTENLKIRCA